MTNPKPGIPFGRSVELHPVRQQLVARNQRLGSVSKGGIVLADGNQRPAFLADHPHGVGEAAGGHDPLPAGDHALGQSKASHRGHAGEGGAEGGRGQWA
jgi:hypothetical protein